MVIQHVAVEDKKKTCVKVCNTKAKLISWSTTQRKTFKKNLSKKHDQ